MVGKGENSKNQHFLFPRIERLGAYCFIVVRPYVRPSVSLHKLDMKTNIFPLLLN